MLAGDGLWFLVCPVDQVNLRQSSVFIPGLGLPVKSIVSFRSTDSPVARAERLHLLRKKKPHARRASMRITMAAKCAAVPADTKRWKISWNPSLPGKKFGFLVA